MSKLIAQCVRLSTKPFECEATHLSRFLLYKSLSGFATGQNAKTVASISGSQRLCEVMGFERHAIQDLNYPEHDLRNLPYSDCSFDACVADQVLEHVEEDPFLVLRECARVVKPNGIVVQTTVMIYPIHYGPKDLWRFTPDGMRFLFERVGLQTICTGSWGGPRAVALVALGLAQLPVPIVPFHPIRRLATNPGTKWPVVVWIVGRK